MNIKSCLIQFCIYVNNSPLDNFIECRLHLAQNNSVASSVIQIGGTARESRTSLASLGIVRFFPGHRILICSFISSIYIFALILLDSSDNLGQRLLPVRCLVSALTLMETSSSTNHLQVVQHFFHDINGLSLLYNLGSMALFVSLLALYVIIIIFFVFFRDLVSHRLTHFLHIYV